LFKNTIFALQEKNNDVKIVARKKEMVFELLDEYRLSYDKASSQGDTILDLGIEMVKRHYAFFRI